ncbi:hypothetical protein LCGC14_2039320 [marine sediment metagenome]|uniref:Uncharacterized protein n=1 Tax=marine sediment metagenome TaxID=412755 RepID=A0A0F9ES79_9ZZZZ
MGLVGVGVMVVRISLLVFILFLFVLSGCGSDSSVGFMEDGKTLYFSKQGVYVGFDASSGRFCVWDDIHRRVFCGNLVEHEWVDSSLIEDLEPK